MSTGHLELYVMITVAIWYQRNAIYNGNVSQSNIQLIDNASSFLAHNDFICQRWRPPEYGSIKINVDGGFIYDSIVSNAVVIIRIYIGELLGVMGKVISKQHSPLALELLVLQEACTLAVDNDFMVGTIKMGSKQAIDLIYVSVKV